MYCSRLGPLRLPQLAEYFSTFGTVVNMGAGEDKNNPGRLHHAIVEFREEGAVRKVGGREMDLSASGKGTVPGAITGFCRCCYRAGRRGRRPWGVTRCRSLVGRRNRAYR